MKSKGIVEVRKLNKDTLEEIESKTYFNLITDRALRTMLNYGKIGDYIGISDSAATPNKFAHTLPVIEVGYTPTGVTSPVLTDSDPENGTPIFGEWTARFNAPTQDRTINTIFLAERNYVNNGKLDTMCYVLLDVPCIQNANEILDVYYRVQFIEDESLGNHDLMYAMAESIVLGDTTTIPDWYFATWNPNAINAAKIHNAVYPLDGYLENVAVSNNGYVKKKTVSWAIDRDFNDTHVNTQGAIYGSIVATDDYYNNNGIVLDASKVLSSTDSKIQPVFFHNKDSSGPFQNVNTLALGKGVINIGGTWEQKGWPHLYRVDITKGGDTGTSEYKLRHRAHLGFMDNGYSNRPSGNVFNKTPRYNSGKNDKFFSNDYIEEFVMWDSTGLTIADMISAEYEEYSNNTTPALDATDITQVCSNGLDNETVWVACRNTGLYKVDRINNTITKISPDASLTDQCYGVDFGPNGSIWAMMEGGLVSSDDNGNTWTIYNGTTPTTLDITGIGTWSDIKFIRVDPWHPDNRILLIPTVGRGGSKSAYWWHSANGGETLLGPTIRYIYHADDYICASTTNGWLQVSDTGSYWVEFMSGYYLYTLKYSFGSSQYIEDRIAEGYAYRHNEGAPGFLYGKNGTPRAQSLKRVFTRYNTPFTIGTDRIFSYGGGWTASKVVARYTNEKGITTAHANMGLMCDLNEASGPLSGALKDFIWTEYGWNSSTQQWEKDYFGSEPTDLVSNYRMVRYGFDANSWQFNGENSYLQIFPRVEYDTPPNIRTIAFTIADGGSADDGTERYALDIDANPLGLKWYSSNLGRVGFHFDGTDYDAFARPSDANRHRVVITVDDARNLFIYLDGSVAYTTTLSSIPQIGLYDVFTLGCNTRFDFDSMFKGTIEKVQFFGTPFTDALAADDYTNYTDLSYQASADIIAHWRLDDAVPETGAKPTHTAEEALVDGITVSFNDDPNAIDQWVNSDYYTFGAMDGFWKDNIRNFSGEYHLYMKPHAEDTIFTPQAPASDSITLETLSDGIFTGKTYPFVALGDQATQTGAYHEGLEAIDKGLPSFSINIDGVPASILQTIYGAYDIGNGGYYESNVYQESIHISMRSRDPVNVSIGDSVYVLFEDGVWRERTVESIDYNPTYDDYQIFYVGPRAEVEPNSSNRFIWIPPILQGEVALIETHGTALFNDLDVGKTITGNYTYTYGI